MLWFIPKEKKIVAAGKIHKYIVVLQFDSWFTADAADAFDKEIEMCHTNGNEKKRSSKPVKIMIIYTMENILTSERDLKLWNHIVK